MPLQRKAALEGGRDHNGSTPRLPGGLLRHVARPVEAVEGTLPQTGRRDLAQRRQIAQRVRPAGLLLGQHEGDERREREVAADGGVEAERLGDAGRTPGDETWGSERLVWPRVTGTPLRVLARRP